jgi:outer membrane protein
MRHSLTTASVIAAVCMLSMSGARVHAQSLPTAPLLTEQEAVEIAKSANRQTKRVSLDIDRAAQSIWEAKTNYLPQSSIRVTSGYPLADFNFTIPKGALGNYPSTGPVPGTNIGLTTSQSFTESSYAVVAQPIAQLYKIHLGVELAQNARDTAVETMRQQRQSVTDQVRQSYHQICILEVQLEEDASQQKALEEALRTIENNLTQGTALEAERLQAKASLTQQLYTRTKDEDALVSAKEQLNMLLARDVDTEFSVEPLPAPSEEELNLAQARATALAHRPEIRLAKLQIEKANLDVLQEKAGYIPDVNAQLTYVGFQNVNFLPKNAAIAGFSLSWTNPWDWGNRRANIASLRDVTKQEVLSSDDTSQQVTLDVGQRYRSLRESRLLVDAAEVAKQASAENLRNITNQFRQHEALLSDVLRQAAVDRTQSGNYAQALGTYWTARADFDHALGRD